MTNNVDPVAAQELAEMYRVAFHRFDPDRLIPSIDIRFYPYVGINHTIRVREGDIFVRIADVCRDMPADGQRALAYILVAKLLGKRVPKNARDVYAFHTKTAEMRERATENKRSRGRKMVSSPKGQFFDLSAVFDDLNQRYFRGRLAKPVLSWSARKTYRILGHHDATHQTIVVSRSLDSKDVPGYVVDYIVFHEMLHIHHPTLHLNGRRYNHTPAFRRDEERFEHFAAAESWIERNVGKLKRAARRKK